MRILAVDFGTSNTAAALGIDGGTPRLVTIDGSPLLPSSVYLTDDGLLAVGRDADRQARIDPSRYEPNPKRRIDEGELLLGTAVLPVTRVIAAVLGRIVGEVRRQLGGPPDEVRLTHPARWGQRRKDILLAAAREAGLTGAAHDPVLIPEPVAAATHFATLSGDAFPEGRMLAVYDLGGGTFDVAIVARRGGYEIMAEAGLPDLGGLDFDHAIVEHIGRTHAVDADREGWARLLHPTDAASRRLSRALMTDIRDAKEALSRYPHTDIALPPPFADAHLTRAEFEQLIRPNLSRSVDLLQHTIRTAGATPAELSGVYLVGGSSRIPLVARLIQEGLGITPTTLDAPETSVVSGALYLATPPAPPRAAPAMPPRPVTAPPAASTYEPPPAMARPSYDVPITVPQREAPPPRRHRLRWLLAGAAALVAAGVVAAILLLPDGGTAHNAGQATTTPATTAPTATATGGPTDSANTCNSNFDRCIDNTAIRGYLQPTYGDIRFCTKNSGFGASLGSALGESGTSYVGCTYKNGYEVAFGVAPGNQISAIRLAMNAVIAGEGGLVKQQSPQWSKGEIRSYSQKPKGGLLYWDYTDTAVFGMAQTTKDPYFELQSWWKNTFDKG